jgi:hypothetical protein
MKKAISEQPINTIDLIVSGKPKLSKRIFEFIFGLVVFADYGLLILIIFKAINCFGGTITIIALQCAIVYPIIKLSEYAEAQNKMKQFCAIAVIAVPILLLIFLKMK